MSRRRYHGITAARGHRHGGTYQVQIRFGERIVTWPQRFRDAVEAARLADALSVCVRGPDARLNFDGQPPEGISWQEVLAFLAAKGDLPQTQWGTNPGEYLTRAIARDHGGS